MLVLTLTPTYSGCPATEAIEAAALAAIDAAGFVAAALGGLARTAVSDYRRLRAELGLTHYAEAEMLELLRDRGFSAERRPANIGPHAGRMTFLATAA